MPVELENSSTAAVSAAKSGAAVPPAVSPRPVSAPFKKKRNLPGMPDPNADVIALSPRTLMATNRFVCEICNKGFQRDQNLQLHRRGHNLPWKLRQRTDGEPRKRVYVCPEPSCIHHDPSRALGDLTGIKKHFCRKHGEKKWKCDKCSKKYAVQSDWKAHSKTCGTKEYRCDCGTLFSRKDSFITHRAFCDALAEESAKGNPYRANGAVAVKSVAAAAAAEDDTKVHGDAAVAPSSSSTSSSSGVVSTSLPAKHRGPENPTLVSNQKPATTQPFIAIGNNDANRSSSSSSSSIFAGLFSSAHARRNSQEQSSSFPNLMDSAAHAGRSLQEQSAAYPNLMESSAHGGRNIEEQSSSFPNMMQSSARAGRNLQEHSSSFSNLIESVTHPDHRSSTTLTSSEEPTLLCLSTYGSNLFTPLTSAASQPESRHFTSPTPAHMSATALLQKAAQMGVTASKGGSLLRGLGLSPSSPTEPSTPKRENLSWQHQVDPEAVMGLGLGLPYGGVGLADDLMMGAPSSLFGAKLATVDFLGLGMGGGGDSGFSALMSSIGGGLDEATASLGGGNSPGRPWEGVERKPSSPALM